MMATAQRTKSISVWERYVTGTGLTLTLAILLVLTVTWPIQRANWVDGMFPAPITGMLSAVLTALLVRTGMPGWRILAISALAGFAVVVFVGAGMMVDANPISRIADLVRELGEWFAALRTDEIRSGLVEFGMFLTAVSWLLGFIAVWMAVRLRQAWAAVALGGITLTIALSNAAGNSELWLGIFMVAAVLMLIHVAIAQRMVGWRFKRLAFEPSTVLWQSFIVLIAGVVIILLVSLLPAPTSAPLAAVSRSLEGVAHRTGEEFSRLFNGLPSRRHVHTITFDAQTRFGGNPHLTPDLLFTVRGDRPLYWRARTYTTYAGTGWTSSAATWRDFVPAGEDDRSRVSARYTFDVAAATDTFFTAGLPASFDQAVEGLVLGRASSDPLQVRFKEGREFFPTRTNLRYTSVGNRSTASGQQLLLTEPAEYPAALYRTYTQLPDNLPSRVRGLARDITRDQPTAYEKARAIQDYLMTFPYNLNIVGPPAGRDGVDYFLFDLRQGYCDYYASAMTVMLRSVGIPARYVLGYTSGYYNGRAGVWEVLQLNYHAWVEVYFPEYGWIQFEPTPSSGIEFGGQVERQDAPLVQGPVEVEGEIPEDDEEPSDFTPGLNTTPTAFLSIGRVIAAVLIAIAAFVSIVFYRWWWRLARYPKADELYAKMGKLATLLGVPPNPADTPAEFAALLSQEIPEHSRSFDVLARVYASRRYGGRTISMGDVRRAEEAWESIRWPLVRRLFRVRPA